MNKVKHHTESKELLWQYSHSTFRPYRHHWTHTDLRVKGGPVWSYTVFLRCLASSLKKFNGQVISARTLL